MEGDVILRSGAGGLEGVEVRIFIGEQNLQVRLIVGMQAGRKFQPGAAAS